MLRARKGFFTMEEERSEYRRQRRRRAARRRTPLQRAAVSVLAAVGIVLAMIAVRTLQANRVPPNEPPDSELLESLEAMASQDVRVREVIDNCEDYPTDILKMLAKNPDMLEFVLGYPENKGQVLATDIGEVEKGQVPLLLQYDTRWGYGAYGSSTVVVSGCGPTCLAMVIAGLTGDNSVTPYDVAHYANAHGYYVPGAGTSWTLMSKGSSHFGVVGEELPLVESIMKRELEEGHPIICSVRPGDFTTTGHFIVVTGVEDGQFTVNDPNSTKRSEMLWDYETLSPQISNLWAFHAE